MGSKLDWMEDKKRKCQGIFDIDKWMEMERHGNALVDTKVKLINSEPSNITRKVFG